MEDIDEFICTVCNRVVETAVGRGFQHTSFDREQGEDHLPVPVNVKQITWVPQYRCDFCCLDDEEIRVLRVNTFTMVNLYGEDQVSITDWCACPKCADLIDAGKWDALTDRVVRVNLTQRRDQYRGVSYKLLYRELRKLYRDVEAHAESRYTERLIGRHSDD